MPVSSDEFRRSVTFEQAEGREPLPSQLDRFEVSNQLRALLWEAFLKSIDYDVKSGDYMAEPYVSGNWVQILKDKHVLRDHKMIDEFSSKYADLKKSLKATFSKGDYADIFGFVQFTLRHSRCPRGFWRIIQERLEVCHAAYRIVDERHIFPITSDEETSTLLNTLEMLKSAGYSGARSHLIAAGGHLADGNWADSVRESIHAVEAILRTITDQTDFGSALKEFEKSSYIHPALKKGFEKIYGYTSDEQGIRHSLIDAESARTDEYDAIFMLGACASFVTYVTGKARKLGTTG